MQFSKRNLVFLILLPTIGFILVRYSSTTKPKSNTKTYQKEDKGPRYRDSEHFDEYEHNL